MVWLSECLQTYGQTDECYKVHCLTAVQALRSVIILIFLAKATKWVHEAHLHRVHTSCVIGAVPSQPYEMHETAFIHFHRCINHVQKSFMYPCGGLNT